MEALDALAGVLLGALVERYPEGMDVTEAVEYSECGSEVPVPRGEAEVACWLLVGYSLAEPAGDEQWCATRAAVKAEQINF